MSEFVQEKILQEEKNSRITKNQHFQFWKFRKQILLKPKIKSRKISLNRVRKARLKYKQKNLLKLKK